MHVHALKTHTNVDETTKRKRLINNQIRPSVSNPVTRVIKDAHSLLWEDLSCNLQQPECSFYLDLGLPLGLPSGILATTQTQLPAD